MKTKEQIIDDINNYIFGTAKLGEEYTEEMRDIVFDTQLGIEEMTRDLKEKNGGKDIDVNNPLFDDYDRLSDEIVEKGAEKIYNLL